MNILAIESSCDETAAAVVNSERQVLSDVVASQIKDHAAYGGVVPEIASRCHIELISPVVDKALEDASMDLSDIDGIAVTRGPGLIGALLVGISYAKALAYGRGIPVYGVNHLEGHLSAALIGNELTYPHLGMVVSGGHTSIYKIEKPGSIVQVGQTLDDAAGEAFDKVAKLLGLGYPGGVIIDRISKGVNFEGIELPRPMMKDDNYDFSFSGLKTAVLNLVIKEKMFAETDLRFSGLPGKKTPLPGKENLIPKISAAFQNAVVDVIATKVIRAAKDFGMDLIVISGGVASNSALRQELAERCAGESIRLVIPEKRYCTDNAVMIGMAGIRYLEQGFSSGLDMNAVSRWEA